MQLVLNTYGTYLHKDGDCFEIKINNEKKTVSANKVQSIWISTAATLSTDAIKLAIEHNIDIVFIDHNGHPYARIWQSKLGSTTQIRRRQLQVSEGEQGLAIARDWILTKMQHQIDFLKELQRHRPEKMLAIEEFIRTIQANREKIASVGGDLEVRRDLIRSYEGAAGHAYFACLASLVPDAYAFKGRSHQPARDPFNAMLNYAYGILYGMVERACLLAGLDPYIGFFHCDNYNKKSLVFDIIEPFRYLADQVVFYLFSKRQVKKEYFNEIPHGFTLNAEGKKILIQAFNESMDQRLRYRGRNIAKRDIIQFECHRLANVLLGKE